MKIKKRWIILFFLIAIIATCSVPEIMHENKGESKSTGDARDGKLINGWLMPYNGNNFKYFSFSSYYLFDNAYVHSAVHATLMDSYKTCENTCPDKNFILMECTRKNGGEMVFHWTHENGVSVDFMVPKKRKQSTNVWLNHVGLFHYLLKFDDEGKSSLGSNMEIDFETMACHLLALDDAARKNGIRIRRVLFKTELHDNLFNSPSGKLLAQRELNFIPRLRDLINRLHDDHY